MNKSQAFQGGQGRDPERVEDSGWICFVCGAVLMVILVIILAMPYKRPGINVKIQPVPVK